MVQKLIKENI